VSILSFAKEDKLIVSNSAQTRSVRRPRPGSHAGAALASGAGASCLERLARRFKPVTVKLLMVHYDGLPFRRGGFRLSVWLPALKKAGIEKPTRADGMHALRHLYASVLLDAGESIKALSS
jgi:hypothetical protein